MKVTLFDYGAGNIHSLGKALARAGAEVDVETDARRCLKTDALVLPGVGAFGHAAERLSPALEEVRQALADGHPCLGICLGMQLLFEASDEGPGSGLGYFRGRVGRLSAQRIPHIGWNSLEGCRGPVADARVETVYYAHSYACRTEDAEIVLAWTEHENDRFPAAVRQNQVWAFQFHPEKSSDGGLRLLEQFVREVAR